MSYFLKCILLFCLLIIYYFFRRKNTSARSKVRYHCPTTTIFHVRATNSSFSILRAWRHPFPRWCSLLWTRTKRTRLFFSTQPLSPPDQHHLPGPKSPQATPSASLFASNVAPYAANANRDSRSCFSSLPLHTAFLSLTTWPARGNIHRPVPRTPLSRSHRRIFSVKIPPPAFSALNHCQHVPKRCDLSFSSVHSWPYSCFLLIGCNSFTMKGHTSQHPTSQQGVQVCSSSHFCSSSVFSNKGKDHLSERGLRARSWLTWGKLSSHRSQTLWGGGFQGLFSFAHCATSSSTPARDEKKPYRLTG